MKIIPSRRTWSRFCLLCLSRRELSLSLSLSVLDNRIPEESKALLLKKVIQGKIFGVFEDLDAENPCEASDVKGFQFPGRNISRLSATARYQGKKANAFALPVQGAVRLKDWLAAHEKDLSKSDKVEATGLMGRLNKSRMKDERQAIPFYHKAGWENYTPVLTPSLINHITPNRRKSCI